MLNFLRGVFNTDGACRKSQGKHGVSVYHPRGKALLQLLWVTSVVMALALARTCPQGSDPRWMLEDLPCHCAWHNLDKIRQENVFPWTAWWRKLCVRNALVAALSLLTSCSLPFIWAILCQQYEPSPLKPLSQLDFSLILSIPETCAAVSDGANHSRHFYLFYSGNKHVMKGIDFSQING